MKRREFITLLGGAAAWPLAARAQQPAMPVIGFLNGTDPKGYARPLAAFLKGMGETGYVEGRNVAIEYRWAEEHYDRLPGFVADLVRRKVDVLAATSTPAAVAAKAAASTIPMVFTTSSDPVRLGLVASLSHPEGNVTGVSQLNVEVLPKRLELVREVIPKATRIGLLVNRNSPIVESLSRDLQGIADALGLQLDVLYAGSEDDFAALFATMTQRGTDAMVIGTDPLFNAHAEQLAALALRSGLPTIYQYPEFTLAGGLMSYGGSIAESYRLAGAYVGRILKGEKPANLPVQQVTKIELVTAKALGVAVPTALLVRADEVIE